MNDLPIPNKKKKLPKWLLIIIYIFLTITLVYWLIVLVFKLLELIRIILHFISDKSHWWAFLVCLLILALGSLLVAQFALGLNPFGYIANWLSDLWHNIRQYVGLIITG